MKAVVFSIVSLVISTAAFAQTAPRAQMRATQSTLFVTLMGDSCNHISSSLKVDPSCRRDRLTRDAVIVCDAELMMFSTAMGCADQSEVERTVEADLAKSNVASEARFLNIKFGGMQYLVPVEQ